jgi:hypothetical protein
MNANRAPKLRDEIGSRYHVMFSQVYVIDSCISYSGPEHLARESCLVDFFKTCFSYLIELDTAFAHLVAT